MTDVVQQDREAQDLTKSRSAGLRKLPTRFREERIEHARRDIHRANAVRVARVRRPWKSLVSEAELFDATEALVDPAVYNGQLSARDRDTAVDGVSNRDH